MLGSGIWDLGAKVGVNVGSCYTGEAYLCQENVKSAVAVAFAYQVCDVETSQAGATYLTSYNVSGVNFPSSGYYDISATTSTRQMVRFGWLVKLSTGSTQSFGYVGGSVAIMECD